MRVALRAGTAILLWTLHSAAQGVNDTRLARLLADESTRDAAIAEVVIDHSRKLPLLLKWVVAPPRGVDSYNLRLGLATAFGRLKTRAAIPFLITNISLDNSGMVNTWLKSAEAIEERMPAAWALIEMGPVAIEPLVQATWQPITSVDRTAIMFTISRIARRTKSKSLRDFLQSSLAEVNLQRYWIAEGLKSIGSVP